MTRKYFILSLSLFLLVCPFVPCARARATHFHTHEELDSMFKALVDAHDGASYYSIGKSYEGRDIWMFEFGTPTGGTVMWDGCMHGWEDMGSEIMYCIAQWVLESGEPAAQRMLQRNRILFIPVLNPDSNRRQNNNFEQCQYGVDLNRNFVHGWKYTPCGDYPNCYHGVSAGSEPETQALRAAFQTYKPDFYCNTHYGGGPWIGYYRNADSAITDQVIQRMKELCNEFGVNRYSSTSTGGGGFAIADAHDFGAHAWLLEAADDAISYSYSDVQNDLLPKSLAIFQAMCEICELENIPPSPEYECPYCDATFSTQQDLDDHIASQHPTPVEYACPHCEAVFGSQAELDNHIEAEHSQIEWYECPDCGAKFPSLAELNDHIANAHATPPTTDPEEPSPVEPNPPPQPEGGSLITLELTLTMVSVVTIAVAGISMSRFRRR